jgi:hypothetical protein
MRRIHASLVFAALALTLVACGSTSATPVALVQPTVDVAVIQTIAAQDVIANLTASAPTATFTPTASSTPAASPTPKPPTNTPTPVPTPTQEIAGLVKEGVYLVGTDIKPGIYAGLAGEGVSNSCYWARLSNLSGSDDILANDNAEGLYYVEILPEDKAFTTACEMLPIEQVPARDKLLTVLSPGAYLVGRDIEAGTYRGKAGSDILESCYWARLRNVSGDNDILANDNATGQYFIEVRPTDFALKVSCEVEKTK